MKHKNLRDIYSYLTKDLVFDSKRDTSKANAYDDKRVQDFQKLQGKIDVVILEDDPDMSNLLNIFFTQNMLSSYTLKNADEAIDLLKEKQPFLITVDLNLENSTGHKLLSYVQNLKTEQKPWVVVVSAANKVEIEDALFEGGDFYFSKPVNFEDLKVFLEKINSKNRIA